MFCSSLLPVVCRRVHAWFTLFVFVCVQLCHSMCCVVFLFCLSSSCEPYVSLDCPFLIAPPVICNICLMETDHKDNYSQEIILYMTFLRCTRVANDLGRRNTNQNHNTICVGHHYAQANTNNVNKT
jgi:steroid 5-alpha reductase family enzyme